MLLISISKYILYIGRNNSLPEELPNEIKVKFKEKVDVGGVTPITAKQLEDRKHPEVEAAKLEMARVLKEAGIMPNPK